MLQMRAVLNEAVLLAGLYAAGHPAHQEKLHWGRAPSLLYRLSTLPQPYIYADPRWPHLQCLPHVLLPTLISATADVQRNRDVIDDTLGLERLREYARDMTACTAVRPLCDQPPCRFQDDQALLNAHTSTVETASPNMHANACAAEAAPLLGASSSSASSTSDGGSKPLKHTGHACAAVAAQEAPVIDRAVKDCSAHCPTREAGSADCPKEGLAHSDCADAPASLACAHQSIGRDGHKCRAVSKMPSHVCALCVPETSVLKAVFNGNCEELHLGGHASSAATAVEVGPADTALFPPVTALQELDSRFLPERRLTSAGWGNFLLFSSKNAQAHNRANGLVVESADKDSDKT
jgi:hypothetical protein